jgi:hypothetical protein
LLCRFLSFVREFPGRSYVASLNGSE